MRARTEKTYPRPLKTTATHQGLVINLFSFYNPFSDKIPKKGRKKSVRAGTGECGWEGGREGVENQRKRRLNRSIPNTRGEKRQVRLLGRPGRGFGETQSGLANLKLRLFGDGN